MKDIERRFFSEPIEVEAREANSRSITGYAAVFNRDSEDFGGWIERIAPGAFDEVLNDSAAVLFNHDPNLILARAGVTATIEQNSKGLKYRFDAPNTTLGNDVLELVRSGVIKESSFAFTTKEVKWAEPEKKGDPAIRTIVKVQRLYDVSPVTYPAYPDTTVGARDFSGIKGEVEKKEREENDRLKKMRQIKHALTKLKLEI